MRDKVDPPHDYYADQVTCACKRDRPSLAPRQTFRCGLATTNYVDVITQEEYKCRAGMSCPSRGCCAVRGLKKNKNTRLNVLDERRLRDDVDDFASVVDNSDAVAVRPHQQPRNVVQRCRLIDCVKSVTTRQVQQ